MSGRHLQLISQLKVDVPVLKIGKASPPEEVEFVQSKGLNLGRWWLQSPPDVGDQTQA
jgi:hypothetical protein